MKIRKYKLKIGNSGELATLAVLILGGITILGTLFASRLAQEGPRSQSQAQCVSQCAICNPANDTSCNPYEDTTCQVVTLCDGRGKWCWQPDDSCKNRSQPTSTPAVTQPPQTTQPPQPTQPPSGACPGEWECVISGQPVICSDGSQTRANFNNYWCDGEPRWKWEAAGNTNRCGGSATQARPANKPYPQSCYTPTTGPTQPLGTVAPTQPAGTGTCAVSISGTVYSGFCVHQELCPGGIATADQNNFGCGTLGCCLETSAITCSSGFSGRCVTSSACRHDNILPEIPNNYGCGGGVCCVSTPIITITPTPTTTATARKTLCEILGMEVGVGAKCIATRKCLSNAIITCADGLACGCTSGESCCRGDGLLEECGVDVSGACTAIKDCFNPYALGSYNYGCGDPNVSVCCAPQQPPCQGMPDGLHVIFGRCISCIQGNPNGTFDECVNAPCDGQPAGLYSDGNRCFECLGRQTGSYFGYTVSTNICKKAGLLGSGSLQGVVGSENEDFLTVIRRTIEGTFNDILLKIFRLFLTRTPSLQKEPCNPRLGTRPGGCSTDILRITVRPQPTYTPAPTPVI